MAIPFQMITLDKPRKLRLGMREAIEYEKAFGVMIARLLVTGIDVTNAARLLWIMFKQDDPELTLDQTITLVDEHSENIDVVIGKVLDAVITAFGAKSDPNAQATAENQNS